MAPIKLHLLLICILLPSSAVATKFPNLYFDIYGKVIDSNTKTPVAGVKILGFLNNSSYSDNTGFEGDNDFPSLPETKSNGLFVAKTVLLRGEKIPKELKLELITLKQGYRTERFEFNSSAFLLPKTSNSRGRIEIKDIEIFKTKKL